MEPEFVLTDFAKMERPAQLHLGYVVSLLLIVAFFFNISLLDVVLYIYFTLSTLTSVCIFSTLFFIYFLWCLQWDFVKQSRAFFISNDLFLWP